MKNFKIRQETKEDLDEVYQLIKTAFETAKVKDGDEQDFAVKLQEGRISFRSFRWSPKRTES